MIYKLAFVMIIDIYFIQSLEMQVNGFRIKMARRLMRLLQKIIYKEH